MLRILALAVAIAAANHAHAGGDGCCFGGDCYIEGGCDDEACCALISAIDPFCFEVAWDGICADQAIKLCVPQFCADSMCRGGISESERCGEQINGGCDVPQFASSPIACGQCVRGMIWGTPESPQDTDWYLVTVLQDRTHVDFSLTGSFPGVLRLYKITDVPTCIEVSDDDVHECRRTLTTVVDAGTYAIRVSAILLSSACPDSSYSLRYECRPAACADPVTFQAPVPTEDAYFGSALAVQHDTLLVGAADDKEGILRGAGSAHVFDRDGASWTSAAILVAQDAGAEDLFGSAVAIDGDTAVAGAPRDDHSGLIDAGSAYVFDRIGGAWSQTIKLTAGDAAADDRFGASVSIDGDTIIIGSPEDDLPTHDAGSAYIFVRTNGIWSQSAKLLSTDVGQNDAFGTSVLISGDTAFVGAPFDSHSGVGAAGAVYVYTRSGTIWNSHPKLIASDPIFQAFLGAALGLDGDSLLVSAPSDDPQGVQYGGSAYVFVRNGPSWVQQAKLMAPQPQVAEHFGTSVSIEGDHVLIGAPGPFCSSGSSFVFHRSNGRWSQAAQLSNPTPEGRDRFGQAAALAGNHALVGADRDDLTALDAGSVHVFKLSPNPADVNCDDAVNVADLLLVIGSWGRCPAPCPADVAPPPTGDGQVNVYDLLTVISNWSA